MAKNRQQISNGRNHCQGGCGAPAGPDRDAGAWLGRSAGPGEPGPGLAVVHWLYARRVAVTGADTWSYGPVPGEDPARPFLVPQTMYAKLGLFGLENLKTEELAEKRVYEFLFVLTHAKTRGSTAAVVAPAAIY